MIRFIKDLAIVTALIAMEITRMIIFTIVAIVGILIGLIGMLGSKIKKELDALNKQDWS